MELSILGPLTVVREAAELELGGSKPRGLLALLALHPGTAVSTDRIVDVLWGDSPPRQAIASLQAYVSNLRRLLEPDRPPRAPATVLVTRGDGYLLDLAPEQVDAGRFEAHAHAARRALSENAAQAALAEADAALSLWRGRPVPELGEDSSIVPERVRLDELRTGLREDRAEAALLTGLPIIGDLETLIAEDHLRERPWILLLRAMQRDGRVAEALERYQRYRKILDEEVGLEPSRALQDLQRELLAGELGPSVPPTTRDEPARPPGGQEAPDVTAIARTPRIAGRQAERERLREVLQASGDGARWVLIIGEAGIGKTTLAEYLSTEARRAGHSIGWARCPEELDAPPYWPISELFDDLGLARLGDLQEPARSLDDRTRTFRLYEDVGRHLAQAATSAPVLLVIDDLHWADPATIRLLSYLSGRFRVEPVTVAATLRGEDVGHDLDELLSTLARDASVDRINVSAMPREELQELAAQHGLELGEPELELLADRSSGNPFFATELLRLPSEEWGGAQRTSVPAGVREVIRRRLRRLGREVVDVLTVAAGIGVEFDLPLLLAASGASSDDVLDRLDRALAAKILADTPEGLLKFQHALVRDTLADDLTVLGHQRLHARLGDALETLPGHEARIGELARHRLAAVTVSGAAAAVDAAVAAARQAAEGLAHDQAALWLTDALKVTDSDPVLSRDRTVRYELQLERGRALMISGQGPRGWDALAAAFDLAEQRSDRLAMAEAMNSLRIASGSWNWVPFGERPWELIRRIEAALAGLPIGYVSQRVGLLITLAEAVYFVDPLQSEAIADEAVELARTEGDDADLAEALIGQLVCSTLATATPTTQLRRVEEFGAIEGERSPLLDAPATIVRWRATTELGERDAADGALATAEQLAETFPIPFFRAELAWVRMTHRVLRNDLAEIDEELERAARLHERVGLYAARELRAMQLILARWWQGRVGECEELFERDLAHAGLAVPEFRALILMGSDRRSAARTVLEAPAPDLPANWSAVTVACLRAWVGVKAGVPTGVHDALRVLIPRRDEIAVFATSASVGPVALYTGVAHAAFGDTNRAQEDLRVAVGHAERGVAGPWGVLARIELGQLLAGDGRASSESRQLLTVARDEADASGSAEFSGCVRELTADLDA